MTLRSSARGPALTSCQRAMSGMPAVAIALWIDSYGGESADELWQSKATNNKGVVVFFADFEGFEKVKISSTRGFPNRAWDLFLAGWFIRTLACLEGLFCMFVLLANLT